MYADLTEGVPVRLSDKYKRPPGVDLPSGVAESAARAQAFVDSLRIDDDFERAALARVAKIRSEKQTRGQERAHRLRLRDLARQQRLDTLAAAEAEERLRQLCVADVSYPSADDPVVQHGQPPVRDPPPFPCHTILQPSRPPRDPRATLLDDPDPLEELKAVTRSYRAPPHANVEELTFSDFEYDTCSPFDNEELKTLNEMEMLAQVLDPTASLSESVRATCREVHAQGFPMPRVVRVCSLLGEDKDTVLRALQVMGELLARGHPEGAVLAALERNHYHRERALADLNNLNNLDHFTTRTDTNLTNYTQPY